MAILIYFKNDLLDILLGLFDKKRDTHKVAWYILWASLPAGIIGFFTAGWIELSLRNPTFVGVNLLVWSIVFYFADRFTKSQEISYALYIDFWSTL